MDAARAEREYRSGLAAHAERRYEDSCRHFNVAADICANSWSKATSLRPIVILRDIGRCCIERCDYREALGLFELAFNRAGQRDVRRVDVQLEHADILRLVAMAYESLAHFKAASNAVDAALEWIKAAGGSASRESDLWASLSVLFTHIDGEQCHAFSENAKQLAVHVASLDARLSTRLTIATGICLASVGIPAEAAETFNEALPATRELYGPDSVETASLLCWLCTAYRKAGDLRRAVESGERSAFLYEYACLWDTAGCASAYFALGSAVFESKEATDYAEAKLESCLAIRRRIFSSDHPGITEALTLLGQIYTRRGKAEAADTVLAEALWSAGARVRCGVAYCDGPGCSQTAREDGTGLFGCPARCGRTFYCSVWCAQEDKDTGHEEKCDALAAVAAAAYGAKCKALIAEARRPHCHGPDCEESVRWGDGTPLFACLDCGRAFYCSVECAQEDRDAGAHTDEECEALSVEAASATLNHADEDDALVAAATGLSLGEGLPTGSGGVHISGRDFFFDEMPFDRLPPQVKPSRAVVTMD